MPSSQPTKNYSMKPRAAIKATGFTKSCELCMIAHYCCYFEPLNRTLRAKIFPLKRDSVVLRKKKYYFRNESPHPILIWRPPWPKIEVWRGMVRKRKKKSFQKVLRSDLLKTKSNNNDMRIIAWIRLILS